MMKNLSSKMALAASRLRGFTLIELMVTVVIIGILAAIAYPSYQEQVRKARRADGKAMLMDVGQRLERCYTRFASYVGNDADCNIVLPDDSLEGFYVVDGERTASTYVLTATPQGDQVNDAKCAALTYASNGDQDSSGTADKGDCW